MTDPIPRLLHSRIMPNAPMMTAREFRDCIDDATDHGTMYVPVHVDTLEKFCRILEVLEIANHALKLDRPVAELHRDPVPAKPEDRYLKRGGFVPGADSREMPTNWLDPHRTSIEPSDVPIRKWHNWNCPACRARNVSDLGTGRAFKCSVCEYVKVLTLGPPS